MPRWKNQIIFSSNMLFGMPATMGAKNWLQIKSWGVLLTACIEVAHRLIHFSEKTLFLHEKSLWKCQKTHFLLKITCLACWYAVKNVKSGMFHGLLWFYNTRSARGTWRLENYVNITIPTGSIHFKKMWQQLIFYPVLVQMSHMERKHPC